MKKENEPDNGISFLDYVRHYTFAVASGLGSTYCFIYGFAKDRPNFIAFGLGALVMASLRACNGYVNLKKMKTLYKENIELKQKLEEMAGD